MSTRHAWLYRFAVVSRLLAWVLRHGLVIAIAAFFISPVGPHLLWGYHYRGSPDVRFHCTYVGSRGFIDPGYVAGCPYIAWLDSRGHRR